jgi:hypothetical protein
MLQLESRRVAGDNMSGENDDIAGDLVVNRPLRPRKPMMSVDPAVRLSTSERVRLARSVAVQALPGHLTTRPSHDQRMWFARHRPISRDVKRPVLMQGPAAGVPGAGGVSPGGLMWVLLLGCDDIPTAARFSRRLQSLARLMRCWSDADS